jgi:hypothetical protein
MRAESGTTNAPRRQQGRARSPGRSRKCPGAGPGRRLPDRSGALLGACAEHYALRPTDRQTFMLTRPMTHHEPQRSTRRCGQSGKEERLVNERRRLPLQNRVTPTGEIVSHPARGMLMGNRGCIHSPSCRSPAMWLLPHGRPSVVRRELAGCPRSADTACHRRRARGGLSAARALKRRANLDADI